MKTFNKEQFLKVLSEKVNTQEKANKLYKKVTGEDAPKGGGKKSK